MNSVMQLRQIFPRIVRGLITSAALLSLLASVPVLRAQEPAQTSAGDTHIVSPAQLQQQVQAASADRQAKIDTLTQFLSTSMAERAMKSVHVDAAQVRTAIPNLSDSELADLSARAAHAQQDFAAGALDNNTLLIIILVLVVVILLAVVR